LEVVRLSVLIWDLKKFFSIVRYDIFPRVVHIHKNDKICTKILS